MNKKALLYGLFYSLAAIAFKLAVLLSGNSFSTFGFMFSHLASVCLIVPFYYLLIKSERDGRLGGVIGGREAMKLALTLFAVGALITSIYHYFEVELALKSLAGEYYHGERFLEFLKKQPRIKPEQYATIIEDNIKNVSPFNATTGKLMSYTVIGTGAAFMTAQFMKKSA